ncbi:MAG TPA: Crp/Fnr family transcriptional regulator [Flavobacteriales bacterium]|nr:Crp/Fnr family transcriptional regulator [Flavobacteriales bacterium]
MITSEKIHSIFPGFEKDLIEQLIQVAQEKSVNSGEYLMKTGQHFRNVMVVIEGTIKVYREDDEGNEFFMYYLESGQACALSMICAARFQASQLMAKAETDVTLLTIPLQYMDEWMSKYKTWYYFVLENYRSRFDEVLRTLDHVAFRNMDERLVYYLKRYQDTHKTNLVKISITEIAQELNSSREVISRLLKKLNEKGVVVTRKDHIELINLNKLVDL